MGLYIGWEASEASSPDIPNLFHQVLNFEGLKGFFLEGTFEESLVYRFLTRVSGHREVGKEYDGQHG